MKIKVSNANTPNWKEVTVKSHIPEELKKLEEMARNIWWAWNYEATDLFRDLDPVTWKEVGQNPVALLERLSYEKLEALTQDKVIVKRMNDQKPGRCVVIGNADCPKDAARLKELLAKEDDNLLFLESSIGPVIGSHVGPGMLAVVFWGGDRREELSVADRIARKIKKEG